ncbi:hypothetical protein FRX31_013614 [Thalictrum thalictroides]|uniref:Uncharacterized protein n=1 Tax=Thalictrum thalictroides TaxID=46969 RepID=A0A7J6WH84_THATH|nr:hypothetical protein FRX31_013614 [Thalictrum thalictroides]
MGAPNYVNKLQELRCTNNIMEEFDDLLEVNRGEWRGGELIILKKKYRPPFVKALLFNYINNLQT